MQLRSLAVALLIAGSACTGDGSSSASSPRTPAQSEGSFDGVFEHLKALQEIADRSGGIRAAGSEGFAASVDYVTKRLRSAGYDVEIQEFSSPVFSDDGESTLVVDGESFDDGEDLRPLIFSAPGSIRGELFVLDWDPNAEGREGPACDASNLTNVLPGSVVLVRPGPCFLRDQTTNLQEAGAAAVLVSFPEYEEEPLRPTLISPEGIEVPVYALTDGAGTAIAELGPGSNVRLQARVESHVTELQNVIAQPAGSDGDDVVMLGGHLDSVLEGPGINDNGSGTAVVLDLAERLAEQGIDHVRFAFWAAEEFGLIGSREYVNSLSPDDLGKIDAYLNFDMLGSPNGGRLVYSAEGMPEGSADIEKLFMEHFKAQDLDARTIDITGSSDHTFFASAGVPVGGLYSGSDEIVDRGDAQAFGRIEGEPMDPCYHLACDTFENVDQDLLRQMAAAVDDVVWQLISGTS